MVWIFLSGWLQEAYFLKTKSNNNNLCILRTKCSSSQTLDDDPHNVLILHQRRWWFNRRSLLFLHCRVWNLCMVFFPANLVKWRIWRSLCALQVGWFGLDYHPKKTPFNTLSNEPSFVALSLLITKRLACELLGFQLTQLFPGQN